MEDLTDIDEILEYLTTIGINYMCRDDRISLSSEYINSCFDRRNLIKYYKGFYNTQKFYQLLDNLLVNCKICYKYKETKYNIQIAYDMYYDTYYNDHGIFQVYNKRGRCVGDFKTIEDLMTYMQENHSECVRQDDIKIALK